MSSLFPSDAEKLSCSSSSEEEEEEEDVEEEALLFLLVVDTADSEMFSNVMGASDFGCSSSGALIMC